jgi:hypothetical protein
MSVLDTFIRNILAEEGSKGSISLILESFNNPITRRITRWLPFIVHLPLTEGHTTILSVLSSSCQSFEREFGASNLQVRVWRFEEETEEDATTWVVNPVTGFFTKTKSERLG